MTIIVKQHRQESDPAVVDAVWNIYEQAFRSARTTSVQDQECYTRNSIAEAIADHEHVLFTAWDGNLMVGFTLGTFNPDKARVAYANPHFLRTKYPDESAGGRLCYFTALGTLPQYRGRGAMEAIVSAVTIMIDRIDGVIVFDYSDKVPELPQAFRKIMHATQVREGLATQGTEFETLGTQSYGAIRFLKKP